MKLPSVLHSSAGAGLPTAPRAPLLSLSFLLLIAGRATAAGGTVPAAGQPKPAEKPAASTAASGKVALTVPSGGDYAAYLLEGSAAPTQVQGRAELEAPAGSKKVTLVVLDRKSGYAARKEVEVAGGKDVPFASADFTLLQKLRVEATGKEEKPIKSGSVVLEDSARKTHRKQIDVSSAGVAEFEMVASGAGKLTVAPEGGSATTKEVTLDIPKGETVQTIPFPLPEVTAVVEGAAAAPAAPPAAAGNTPAPSVPAVPPAGSPVPQVNIQVQPSASQPVQRTDYGSMFIGFLVLGGAAFATYVVMKRKGITMDQVLAKLGVQPDTGVQAAGVGGVQVAPRPGPPPPPPPIVSDPNQCPYCGQMKDANGECACTVRRGGAPMPVGGPAAPTPQGSGPRLVATAGTYMGQVYPLASGAVVGRDPGNAIPLERDTTSSRRHAQISESGGVFRIQDLSSSNGTFVNGARITECALSPGDEVVIGGTRFRFEA